jgi:cytochrome c5
LRTHSKRSSSDTEDSMSEVNHPHDEAGPHHGPIRTPKQLVLAVFFAFIVPIIAIILLVSFVASDKQPAAGSEAHSAQATAARIRPVGSVQVKDVSDPSALKTGDQVYTAVCAACHATGTLNAPKLGDAAAWGPRVAQGYEALLTSALKGKGAMPAQGGGDFADLEIARAVVYLANQGGAKFPEPKAPAATAGASPAPAPATTTAAAPAAPAPAATPAATAAAPQATAAAGAVPALYTQSCSACHIAGVAGAPKLGDKAAWAPRISQGVDALTASVIKGKGAMPPKGGTTASDAEIKTAVTYMVNASK